MSDLRELYQQVIVDHSRNPRNFGQLEEANRKGDGFNPLCGDKLHLYLEVENGKVKQARFEGSGCAISTASASMMTECVQGMTEDQANSLIENFHALITGQAPKDSELLGKLTVFAGVCEFPARVKCASLAWHTLKNVLSGSSDVAVTE